MTTRFLGTRAKLKGLSKNKIIIASIVIAIVLIIIVMCSGNDNNNQKQNLYTSEQDSETYTVQSNKSNVDAILNQIQQSDNAKKKVVMVKNTNLNTSASSDVAGETPPITDQEEERFKHVQKTNMYASVSGKSLMFSAKPNASSVSSNKPSLRDSLSIGGDDGSNTTDVVSSKSPYEVKAGSVIPAIMINGLNSDLPGQVIAIVKQNIYDSITRQYILIPQGSRLVGRYDSGVLYGQERIAVAWNQLIYPDGSETNLKAMPGTDMEGYSGFYDQVDNHYWKIFGASFVMGVITGAMQYSQNNSNTNVQAGGNPTVGQTMSSSLGQQLGQTGLAITQKNLNVSPTIVIRPNYPFNIMITADLELKPFARVE